MMKMHVSHTEITIQAVGIDEIVKVHGCRIKNDNPREKKTPCGTSHLLVDRNLSKKSVLKDGLL